MGSSMKSLIDQFEDGTLDLSKFNHKQHLYIAWDYLKRMSVEEAIDRYAIYLCILLALNGCSVRFSMHLTKVYMNRLDAAMKTNPTASFEEIVAILKR